MKNKIRSNKRIVLIVVMLSAFALSSLGQIKLLDPQAMKQWKIPKGNYSGITPLGNNHYAVVSDDGEENGFYEFLIEQNDTTGQVVRVELIAFHRTDSLASDKSKKVRDAEGITFFPDSNTVFISAEDDQQIIEYRLDGQPTGRSLAVPEVFSKDSIYSNYGFEALSFSNATRRFWTTTENSLRKDGLLSTTLDPRPAHLRFQTFNTNLQPAQQYFYDIDIPTPNKRHKTLITGVPEFLALDDGRLLVLERDAMRTKNNIGNRVDNRIYLFSPEDSVKTLQASWTTRFNFTDMDYANYEGMCFGSPRNDGKQTILLLADSQHGKGNFLFRLQDYIRVGVLNDSNVVVSSRERMKQAAMLPPDSVVHIPKFEKFISNRWTQSLYIGVPLIVAGILQRGHDNHFKEIRDDYTPNFYCTAEDYIAVLPVLVTAGLKFAGFDGRSEWPHRVVSGLFSFAINFATIRPTKSLTDTKRPDGKAGSFPSNHAAFVFGATARLVKEYGDISPWIGYGGYTLATGVCAMRMMNNRHWLSDVLVGAGIGILGTEFSYWLADLCCPKWANTYRRMDEVMLTDKGNPHFLGTYAGYYIPLKKYSMRSNPNLTSANGSTFGIEGAYFINKYIGFGGQMSLSEIDYDDVSFTDNGEDVAQDYNSRFTSIKVGCYFNYTPYPRISLGAKVLGGYTHYPRGNNSILDDKHTFGASGLAGISVSLRPREHFLFKVGADYEIFPSPSTEVSCVQSLLLTGGVAIRF